MSLLNVLSSHNADTPVWCFSGDKLTAQDVLDEVYQYFPSGNEFKCKNIAVYIADPLRLACSLIAFDGYANQILLIPEESCVEDIIGFINKSKTNFLVTDRNIDISVLPSGVEIVNIQKKNGTITGYCEDGGGLKTAWLIPTSGTTGTPKLVSHTLDSLTRSVSSNTQKGREYIWGLLYSVTRYAGLQVFLQSMIGGSMLVLTRGDTPLEEKIESIAAANCNALSATPTMWRKILMLPAAKGLTLKQITLGGEAADQHILKALKLRFPDSRIVHIYASTEAGVGFVVTDGMPGFPSSYLDAPPIDIEIRIGDDRMLYLKNNRSTQSYVGTDQQLSEDDGFICTGDVVELKQGRYLFLGRKNGAINIGGNKVQPEEVEQVILSFPGVQLVSISAKKSSITGSLVVADVVMEKACIIDEQKRLKSEIKLHCKSQLAGYKVPAVIRIVKDIDVSVNGKIRRR